MTSIFEKLQSIIKPKHRRLTPTREIIEIAGDDPYEVIDEIIKDNTSPAGPLADLESFGKNRDGGSTI